MSVEPFQAALVIGITPTAPVHGMRRGSLSKTIALPVSKPRACPGFLSSAILITNRLLNFLGRDIKPTSINYIKLEDWRISLEQEGLAGSSIRKYLDIVKSMWNYAGIEPNPFKDRHWAARKGRVNTKVDNLKKEPEEQREFEEQLLLYAHEHYPYLFNIILVALETGLRKSNVLNLRWEEIDWSTGYLNVKVKGKVLEEGVWKPHSVPMTGLCREILSQIPDNGTEFVFVNPATGKPWKKVWASFDTCRRAAGIPKFRIHDLRHAAGTRVCEKLGIYAAQNFLGHSDIKMTQRYMHTGDKKLLEELNKDESKKTLDLIRQGTNVVSIKR